PLAGSFYGRPYFNLAQFRHICRCAGVAPALFLRNLGHAGELRPDDWNPPRRSLRQVLRVLPDYGRVLRTQLGLRRAIRGGFATLKEQLRRLTEQDPAALPDAAVWAVLARWEAEMPRFIEAVFGLGGQLVYQLALQALCERLGVPFERVKNTILVVGPKTVSGQQAFDLLALARQAWREGPAREYFLRTATWADYREALRGTAFLPQFDQFLRTYGHRGTYESDWALPRYQEDPTPLLGAIQAHVRAPDCPAPEAIHARQAREAAATWAALEAGMAAWQKPLLRPLLRWLARQTQQTYMIRERFRSELVRLLGGLRRWRLALAE